jgi:hypothetical protein
MIDPVGLLKRANTDLTNLCENVALARAFNNTPALFHLQNAVENALSEVIEAQNYLREIET